MMLRRSTSRYSLLLVLLALLACTLLQPQQGGGVWVVSASDDDDLDDEAAAAAARAAAEELVDEIVSHAAEEVEEEEEEKEEAEPEPEEEEPEPEPEPPVKKEVKVAKLVETVEEKTKPKISIPKISMPDIKSIVEKVKSKINVIAKKITGMKKCDVKKLVGAALGLWAASVLVGFLTSQSAGTTAASPTSGKGKK
jgi:chromatin segregation and condensation protein Rec8/ScpA/Scc1 (kleisin family)